MTDSSPIQVLSEEVTRQLADLTADRDELRESLENVSRQLAYEDRGWQLISAQMSGDKLEGLDLDEAKEVSAKIRPHVVGDGMVKRGADLHAGYVWSKGINIDGVERKPGAGAPSNLVRFYENSINQETLFSSTAHEELQKARFSDGTIVLLCDTSKNVVRRLPLTQITDIRVDEDFPEDVIMYKRTWTPKPGGDPESRWYYTNRFSGSKVNRVDNGDGTFTTVERNVVAVDRRFNRQVGYVLGIPDALAMMPWAAAYEEIIKYGRVVNEALSKILFKVVSNTKKGAQTAGVKVSGMKGHGNAASMVEGQDIQAISTAGKGYDFTSARPVGAMAAMAINVPNIELLSDSSAAGSSYGAAQSLSPATKNAMRLMQAQWVELYAEVFRVLGLGNPRIWFDSLEDPELYRQSQALTILSPTLTDAEYRGYALDLLDIPGDPGTEVPTLQMRSEPQKQAASPDQGRSNGTGGADSGERNDQRSDNVSEAIKRMKDEDFLDRFESLVVRMESVNGK